FRRAFFVDADSRARSCGGCAVRDEPPLPPRSVGRARAVAGGGVLPRASRLGERDHRSAHCRGGHRIAGAAGGGPRRRATGATGPAVKVPTLLVVGDRDPLLPLPAARALAATVSAEEAVVTGAGHWPHVGPTCSALVNLVHRWLIQRLGEPLLEQYADAMAE